MNSIREIIIIRVDGGLQIGHGHVTRCLALAEHLSHAFEVHFCCKIIDSGLQLSIVNKGFNLIGITDESEFFERAKGKIIILDGYDFDEPYERKLKSLSSIVFTIDDLHSRHYVSDFIINHSPAANPSQYRAEPYTQFLFGPRFALLRSVFIKAAASVIPKPTDVVRCVVCVGGSDPFNLTIPIVEKLLALKAEIELCVIIGSSYANENELANLLRYAPIPAYLKKNLSEFEMAATLNAAQYAIVPASGIMMEAVCCACNILGFFLADNQREFHDFMVRKNVILTFGDNSRGFNGTGFDSAWHRLIHGERLERSGLRAEFGGAKDAFLEIFSGVAR